MSKLNLDENLAEKVFKKAFGLYIMPNGYEPEYAARMAADYFELTGKEWGTYKNYALNQIKKFDKEEKENLRDLKEDESITMEREYKRQSRELNLGLTPGIDPHNLEGLDLDEYIDRRKGGEHTGMGARR